jgi:rod shape-determining protein MreC
LSAKNAALENVLAENDRLRELLRVLPREKYDLETAAVIGGNPNGPGEWLIIDKGSGSGIRESMPVIAHDGVLVGKVENAEYSSARVRLLSSQDSVVNVRTLSTNAKGIVRGRFGLGMILEMVLQTDTLSSGDRLFTSDIGSEYPPGMYVGEIRDIAPSSNSLFQQASVVTPVSYSDLRFVSVVKKSF